MRVIEAQAKVILDAERVNVLFFDHKRNELYRRRRDKDMDTIECTNSLAQPLAYPTSHGLASVAIHTLSAIMCQSAKDDARFYPPVDDPRAGAATPAARVLAVPIMGREDKENPQFKLPRGVVVAVNKAGGQEFTQEDVENVKIYNCLAAKIIETTSYLVGV